MCAGNMAGQKRSQQLKLLRNMFWFGYVLTVQLQNVSAQTESSVLTVADSNWTLILEGEWMLKLWVVSFVAVFYLSEQVIIKHY